MPAPARTRCFCISCEANVYHSPHLKPTRAETFLADHAAHHADEFEERHFRREFTEYFGFAVLNRKTVEYLRPFPPILEVAAGSGYWSWELNQAGIDAVATDPGLEAWSSPGTVWKRDRTVTGQRALKLYPHRNLLLCWPRPEAWTTKVIEQFPGEFLLYVGEAGDSDLGSMTGPGSTFAALEQDFKLEDVWSIPCFQGIHDALYVYRRCGA